MGACQRGLGWYGDGSLPPCTSFYKQHQQPSQADCIVVLGN
jgi:hypothetical protein